MLLGENISLAITSILSNKVRALLTMLGIIIGIASVIAIFTVGNSLTLTVEDNLQSMGANDIYITVSEKDQEDESSKLDGIKYGSFKTSDKMTDSDYITTEMIEDLCDAFPDDIYAINIYSNVGNGSAAYKGDSGNISLMGVSAGYFITNDISITAGSMFSAADFTDAKYVCLVSEDYVEDVFDGDASAAIGNNLDVKCDDINTTFTIIGVYKGQSQMSSMYSFMSSGSTMYIPIRTANSVTHTSGKYSMVQVCTALGTDTESLANEIETYFKPYYRTNDSFEVTAMSFESMVEMLTTLMDTITLAISIIAAIALVVGGIGVMNIMLVSVTERTREIGTRKALGARNSSIRAQFIVESIIICLIGGIIGLIVGLVAGTLLSNYLGYPASPSIGGIILSIGFSMAIGLFFGSFPADKAAKMNPIDALRYE